jgi:hypothetical protein
LIEEKELGADLPIGHFIRRDTGHGTKMSLVSYFKKSIRKKTYEIISPLGGYRLGDYGYVEGEGQNY